MRIKYWLGAAALLAAASAAQAMTVDELIARHIEARGGMKALSAVKTMRLYGKYNPAGGQDIWFSQLVARPGLLRSEYGMQGMTAVTAYDGKGAWQISPFQGRKDPFRMSPEDLPAQEDQADIEGPLVNYKAKGHKVEYLGTEDVDGTEAHKLQVTRKNGGTTVIYLDPDYFLEIREHNRRVVRGVVQEDETDLGDYEKVSGIVVPFSYESGQPGQPKIPSVVEKVEFDVPADTALFAFPQTPNAANKK